MRDSPRNIIIVLALWLAASALMVTQVQAQITLERKGEYAQIDTRFSGQALKDLNSRDAAVRRRTIEQVQATPERYAPPVLYQLSQVLMAEGKPERAMFWFYAGQLRARFDANRCADETAGSAIGVMNQNIGPPINQYAFKNLVLLEKTIADVLAWDRRTPHDYDHRWINLHGMAAMIASMDPAQAQQELSLPESEWEAIAEQTRQDYKAGFQEALEMARKREVDDAVSGR